jgi:hypothetical protein
MPGMSNKTSPKARQRVKLPVGWVGYLIHVRPATSFDFHFESSTGAMRPLRLERGALETEVGDTSTAITSFRAVAYPEVAETQVGFYTSPDSVPMTAEADVSVYGSVSGDSFVCTSEGSWNGLVVTVTVFRVNSDGSITQIIQQNIQDANQHRYQIP